MALGVVELDKHRRRLVQLVELLEHLEQRRVRLHVDRRQRAPVGERLLDAFVTALLSLLQLAVVDGGVRLQQL